MDDTRLEDIPPLGRSVEEIEAEDGSSRHGPGADTPAPVPIVDPGSPGLPGNFTSGSAPIIGPLAAGGHLVNDEAAPDSTEDT